MEIFCLKESLEKSLRIGIVHILGLRELLEGEETRQVGWRSALLIICLPPTCQNAALMAPLRCPCFITSHHGIGSERVLPLLQRTTAEQIAAAGAGRAAADLASTEEEHNCPSI